MAHITDNATRRLSFKIAVLHQIYLEIKATPVAITENNRESASEALYKILSPENNPRSLNSTSIINGGELVLPTAQTISDPIDTHSNSVIVLEKLALQQLQEAKFDARGNTEPAVLKSFASASSSDALALEIATEILKLDEGEVPDTDAAIKKQALFFQWPAIYEKFMEGHKDSSHDLS